LEEDAYDLLPDVRAHALVALSEIEEL